VLLRQFEKSRLYLRDPHGAERALPLAGSGDWRAVMAGPIHGAAAQVTSTVVYHQPGNRLLHRVIPVETFLFASEIASARCEARPDTEWPGMTRAVTCGTEGVRVRPAGDLERNARRVYHG